MDKKYEDGLSIALKQVEDGYGLGERHGFTSQNISLDQRKIIKDAVLLGLIEDNERIYDGLNILAGSRQNKHRLSLEDTDEIIYDYEYSWISTKYIIKYNFLLLND